MSLIRYIYRVTGFLTILGIGTVVVFLIGWIKVGENGVRLGPKIVSLMARSALSLVGIQTTVDRPELLRNHSGFIFSNHTSYMDVIVMMGFEPVRYVAKNEVRRMFFIGRLAWAIGCVFVKREKKESREAARSTLGQLESYKPAIVLYPEGRTAPIGKLQPFRKGAFEIAQDAGIAYLPVSMIYSHPHLVDWRSVPFFTAVWNIMSREYPLEATMLVHDLVKPSADDDPAVLCDMTRAEMLYTLSTKGNYQPEPEIGQAVQKQTV
ncbi:MAG: 1-acyl-sn-glycerol-3-phosphate acyltransferase [Cellvibrionaceae bacterium]|jgi:1-acyl-sn-glycerol-3-phosphate acyltransferase